MCFKPKPRFLYRGSNSETMQGGSEVRPVWVSWPLASPGSHKLACCNSLPDGLAPAGVCLYIRALTGGCKGCNVGDLRCWECSLGGNMQPKYAYPLRCLTLHVDKGGEAGFR